jgi:hypothetical protein
MNLKFDPVTTPAGTRFLYRDTSGKLHEATIREWSESSKYVNVDGEWLCEKDINLFVLVELLLEDEIYKKY